MSTLFAATATTRREIGTPLNKAADYELGTVQTGRSGDLYVVKAADNKVGKSWKKLTKTELAKYSQTNVQDNQIVRPQVQVQTLPLPPQPQPPQQSVFQQQPVPQQSFSHQ